MSLIGRAIYTPQTQRRNGSEMAWKVLCSRRCIELSARGQWSVNKLTRWLPLSLCLCLWFWASFWSQRLSGLTHSGFSPSLSICNCVSIGPFRWLLIPLECRMLCLSYPHGFLYQFILLNVRISFILLFADTWEHFIQQHIYLTKNNKNNKQQSQLQTLIRKIKSKLMPFREAVQQLYTEPL